MSKILAIKGDEERGSEVIALLEMLGGNNVHNLYGGENYAYYVIEGVDNEIRGGIYIFADENLRVFTLDEFYEKYPYKVRDKVTLGNKLCTIIWMCWECNNIYYTIQVQGTDVMYTKKVTADELKPYKREDDMKTKNRNSCANCVFAILDDKPHCGLRGFTDKFNIKDCSAENNILPNGYELQEDGYFSWVQKKPVYPQNYKECCSVLGFKSEYDLNNIATHDVVYDYKLQNFYRLLIARNAYWTIAGKQMGLDKPWEPDWNNDTEYKYGLFRLRNDIYKDASCINPTLLTFPIQEMRDAFYENFKDLIEQCKELL